MDTTKPCKGDISNIGCKPYVSTLCVDPMPALCVDPMPALCVDPMPALYADPYEVRLLVNYSLTPQRTYRIGQCRPNTLDTNS